MDNHEMGWDLAQLVPSTNPDLILEQLNFMITEANKLRDTYHNKIKYLDANGLLKLLEVKDAFALNFEGVTMYCNLIYAANSMIDVNKKLNDSVRTVLMTVSQALAFIDLEIGTLLVEKSLLVNDPLLAEYKHYLERILRRVPHMLSETEERLIILKDRNGINAWQMLQSDWLSTRTFSIHINGKPEKLTYGKIIGLYQCPDRDLRRSANQVVYEELGRDEILWASAIRSICSDHLQMSGLRKFPNPMAQSLIANDVDQRTIESLIITVEKNVRLYQRYLRLKAKLMNLPILANYDILAPLIDVLDTNYTWEESRRVIIDAYSRFDEKLGAWVEEMFEKRHIDGEVRNGKRSGAFCASWLVGKSAYILQSFNGRMGDVYTQAHELGHAVHAYLASRAQKPSNFEIGSCIAECGSIFGELLLTDQLLSKAKTKMEKRQILSKILDKFGMVVFQVSARIFFEQSLYNAIKRGEFLDGEKVARLWIDARDKIYGDSVEWLDVMKWEWTMKGHYYIPNYRFYNYPYVFAQLFVFALFSLYKEEGEEFIPKLDRLLAAGSSKSPYVLGFELGFDISSELFWNKGIKQAEKFVDDLEATLAS
jgi:oligoendopeptidase F